MKSFIAVVLFLVTCSWVGSAFAVPPPHAPAHGYRAKHRYTYYPDHEIYYAPESREWFWIDRDGDWHFGVRLPERYQQFTVGGISIELDSDRPYREHDYVVQRYGKGPKRKNKHKHKY